METEIKKPKIATVIIGILSIILASAISYYAHHISHVAVGDWCCEINIASEINKDTHLNNCITFSGCPLSIIAGPLANIFLAIVSLWAFVKYPSNLFLGALALINSSARLGHAFVLFIQMLLTRYQPTVKNDEWLLITLINFPDMAGALVLVLLYILFNAVLVIIAVRTLTWVGIWSWCFVVAAIMAQIPLNIYFAKYLSAVLQLLY